MNGANAVKIFDLHCDTLLKVRKGGNLEDNTFDVSFKKLSVYEKAGQLFAVFNPGVFPVEDMIDIIGLLKAEAQKSELCKFCTAADDYSKCQKKVAAFASIEAIGNAPDFKADKLFDFYNAGVRIASLTWNGDNHLCGGIGENNKGLTQEGRSTIENMMKLSMGFDVSHISDRGFFEAAQYENLKMLATHSNSRSVCGAPRNITDEQFGVIKSRGGVVGLNLYTEFINGKESAPLSDLIRHIEHFASLGGIKTIALGSDFDGISTKVQGIEECDKFYVLFEELSRLNYKEEQITGIFHDNFLRFFKDLTA